MSAPAVGASLPVRPVGRVEPDGGRVYLHPGQFAVARGPATMSTILGSCVGVCLHDPVAGVGGLNHFLLPRSPAGESSPRYGDTAMPRLIREVVRLGGEPSRMVATIVGGACVIAGAGNRKADLGRTNIAVARAALAEAGIRIAAEDVEGTRGRRVTFDPHAGDVRIRVL